jgi:SAM-dependent methyltransferase
MESMFSGGDAYERFMGRWSRELARAFVRFAGVADGDAVLDVGSGTGALSTAVAAAAPSSRITGVDSSRAYVAFAQGRRPGPLVQFEVGDAQHLEFADDTFDRTLSLLILNFVPEPAQAMSEMARVTRPGGTVAAAVWDYSGGMEMLRMFWDEALALQPGHAARDERHMRFCRSGELGTFFSGHGLQDVAEQGLTIETRFSSFDDYWAPFLEKQGPSGAFVAALSDPDRERLRQRLRARLLEDGSDRPIVLRARAWCARGRRGRTPPSASR